MTCRHPDRDCPKLLCGHPLPCLFHTVVIDMDKTPPTVNIPITNLEAFRARRTLKEIAEAIEAQTE